MQLLPQFPQRSQGLHWTKACRWCLDGQGEDVDAVVKLIELVRISNWPAMRVTNDNQRCELNDSAPGGADVEPKACRDKGCGLNEHELPVRQSLTGAEFFGSRIWMSLFLAVFLPISRTSLAQSLSDLYRVTKGVSQYHVEYHQVTLAKGAEMVLAELAGPGKVTYFYITDDTQVRWYPGLVLKVFWDGETDPSIEIPLADFFGAIGGRTIDFQSLPMQINHGCYMCYLPMPFSQRARFLLVNDGDRDYSQSVAYGIDYEVDPTFAEEKSRLHCSWHRSNPVQNNAAPLDQVIKPSEVGGKNTFNSRHRILEAKGRGHYVGNFLQVFTRSPNWWGEGVTFFHRDGQTVVHSPGTEDEYGSCWGFGGKFSYPYSGYLENGNGNNRMFRWYLANPVRFQESLKVEIQSIFTPSNAPFKPGSDDFTSVAFWYQEEPHQSFGLQSFAERTAPSKASDYRNP